MTSNEVYGLTIAQINDADTTRLNAILTRVRIDAHADGYTGGSWTENTVRAELARRAVK